MHLKCLLPPLFLTARPVAGLALRSSSAIALPNPSSLKNGDFKTHIQPLLLDVSQYCRRQGLAPSPCLPLGLCVRALQIQRMYENVAANHSSCIDSLTRSFDRANTQIAGFTKSFVIELTQQILNNNPGITVECKEQAIRRAMRLDVTP